MSIGKLTATGRTERYYTRAVAQGREDYYAGHGEAPGRWIGSGWRSEESDRDVTERELRGLLEGRHPVSDDPLRRRNARGVMGFDVTFSAPKSVSVVYAVGDRDTAIAVRDAHEAAVQDALGYLERAACRSRRGINGRREVRGEGFLAAAFRHRTSRAGDPQIHTHVVIANATRGIDGRWGTLDGRLLYRHAKTAGYLYQAALRAQLSTRLDVRWTRVRKGSAEIEGIPSGLLHHFSRRRAEVTEQMARRGERSRAAARVATLDTRRRKDYDVPVDRLREQWRARAAEHGFGRDEISQVLHRGKLLPAPRPDVAQVGEQLAGDRGVTRENSTFDRRDVIQACAEHHRHGGDIHTIEQLAEHWLMRPDVVRLDGGPAPRYSTRQLLGLEQELLATAARRRNEGVAQVDRAILENALSCRPTLAAEQAVVVERLTTSGAGVEVVRAAAGTGKTYALDAAREAWRAAGITVWGCALSARASLELRDQAGIQSSTIARLLRDLHDGQQLARGSVLVVDEAGMVGTRDLAALSDHARAAGAKLVLVGDDRQLPEIEAGGAFRALAQQTGALELHEVRRQRHPWDRAALAALRDGNVERFVQDYRDRGRIRAAPSAEQLRERLVADWWRDTREHPDEQTVIIALRRSDVADLNDRAREQLRAAGRLGQQEIVVGTRSFATGDHVVAAQNHRRLGVANGTRAIVTAIDPATRTLEITAPEHEPVELPASFLEAGGLEHGYAMTAHRLQGATVDRTYVLGSDELYREWGYTALSRHRDSATFYVAAEHSQAPLPGFEHEDPLAGDLTSRLQRSAAKSLAIPAASSAASLISATELLRSLPSEVRALARTEQDLAEARRTRDAAIERTRRLEEELHAVGPLRRAQRARLGRRLVVQHEALAHHDAVLAELERMATLQRELGADWMTARENELALVLGEPAPRDVARAIRLLLDREHEERELQRCRQARRNREVPLDGPAHRER